MFLTSYFMTTKVAEAIAKQTFAEILPSAWALQTTCQKL